MRQLSVAAVSAFVLAAVGCSTSSEAVTPVVTPSATPEPTAVPLPDGWRAWCNDPQTASELERLRRSVNRGAPYGAESWVERAASTLGIRSTLRPRGRPTKGTV